MVSGGATFSTPWKRWRAGPPKMMASPERSVRRARLASRALARAFALHVWRARFEEEKTLRKRAASSRVRKWRRGGLDEGRVGADRNGDHWRAAVQRALLFRVCFSEQGIRLLHPRVAYASRVSFATLQLPTLRACAARFSLRFEETSFETRCSSRCLGGDPFCRSATRRSWPGARRARRRRATTRPEPKGPPVLGK